jgi:basic membrane protein A
LAACVLAAAGWAQAQPAVIYELGGKFDRSFNQAAYQGAERWKAETGKPYLEFEVQNAAQREQAARRFAEKGANPIVGIGFPQASSIETVAKAFPNQRFAIIDMVVAAAQRAELRLPRTRRQLPRRHDGRAGQQDRQGGLRRRHGHPAGAQVPVRLRAGRQIRRAEGGSVSAMTGTTPAAWTDPARGAELTKAQIAQGVDVVFAAAGTTGLGIMQAAKDAGKLAIGVDSNQNHLHPGTILTSMVKRVDLAVLQAFKGVQPGITALGLKEGAIDYAMDEHNAKLVPPEMKQKVEAAKADIIAGKLKVIDYTVANACR